MTAESKPKNGLFYRLRVTFLLVVLAVVLIYAFNDIRSRHARTEWKRPLVVAFVVVRDGPVTDESVQALEARVPELEHRLAEEMARYRESTVQPFQISVFGHIDGIDPPPQAPAEPGFLSSIRYQWDLDRWASKVDSSGAYGAKGYDTRIYLHARPPLSEHEQIEGASEEGGRIGVVRVELDESMADFTLFVATHELMHTLGASDKYAPDGSVMIPDGLAEPRLQPLYPQRFAEIMARHRPVSPTQSKPPASLAQLAVGMRTAEEIGWATTAR